MGQSIEETVKRIQKSVSQAEHLWNATADSPEFVRWHMRTARVLETTFGRLSAVFANFANLSWRYRGSMAVTWDEVLQPGATEARYDRPAFDKALSMAIGILQAAIDEVQEEGLEGVYEGKNTPPEASTIVSILHLVEHKLRKLVREKPEKEREVQEALQNLFVGADVDHRREEVHITYSSKNYVPDFTVDRADLAIEVKLSGRSGREKEMIAEINDDIVAYQTEYGNLLFITYDCGIIRDIDKFTAHFEANESVLVRIVKH